MLRARKRVALEIGQMRPLSTNSNTYPFSIFGEHPCTILLYSETPPAPIIHVSNSHNNSPLLYPLITSTSIV